MIIGSGLLARAFPESFQLRDDVCIYAAGVSNSSSKESSEFSREEARLVNALQVARNVNAFVYFGTCSVYDLEMQDTQYVRHKLAMEKLAAEHPHALILRLPQVAGHTPNPHTLLNFIYARVARSEAFCVWSNAFRNIIDVEDVAILTEFFIDNPTMRRQVMNLANSRCYSMLEIVHCMEKVVGKPAIYNTEMRGYHYDIDVADILPVLTQTDISFDSHYLSRVLSKYYEKF